MDLYGPPLPPGYVRPEDDDSDESGSDSSTNERHTKKARIIGPQCPNFLSKDVPVSNAEHVISNSAIPNTADVIGPALPPSFQKVSYDDDLSEEFYGPVLAESKSESGDLNERKHAIEKRAEKMKDRLNNELLPTVETLEREEWMTVPDTSRKNQLGAISRCLAPSKSSSKEKSHHRHSEKDKKTTEELKKYNKSKRSESLLEIHKKDKKKKDKEKEKNRPKERKPFDRDEIGVKHFTKDQVNSVVDKAKYLNSRFAPGNNQYL